MSALAHTALVAALFTVASESGVIEAPAAPTILRWLVPPDRGPRPTEVPPLRYERQAAGQAVGPGFAPSVPSARRGRGAEGSGTGQQQRAEEGDVAVPPDAPVEVAPAFSFLEVDQQIVRHPESAAPAYPPALLARGIEGGAMFRFIVDTTGLIDPASIQLLVATHPAFAQAVREAMPGMRFEAARVGATKVRQLAEQEFRFVIERPAPPRPPGASVPEGSAR